MSIGSVTQQQQQQQYWDWAPAATSAGPAAVGSAAAGSTASTASTAPATAQPVGSANPLTLLNNGLQALLLQGQQGATPAGTTQAALTTTAETATDPSVSDQSDTSDTTRTGAHHHHHRLDAGSESVSGDGTPSSAGASALAGMAQALQAYGSAIAPGLSLATMA